MEQKQDDIEQVMHEMETKEAALKSEVPNRKAKSLGTCLFIVCLEGGCGCDGPGVAVGRLRPRHMGWTWFLGPAHLYSLPFMVSKTWSEQRESERAAAFSLARKTPLICLKVRGERKPTTSSLTLLVEIDMQLRAACSACGRRERRQTPGPCSACNCLTPALTLHFLRLHLHSTPQACQPY